jgi:hypothetical protein
MRRRNSVRKDLNYGGSYTGKSLAAIHKVIKLKGKKL